MRFPFRIVLSLTVFALGAGWLLLPADERPEPRDVPADRLQLSDKAQLGTTWPQLAPRLYALEPLAPKDQFATANANATPKGAGESVYPKVAPAVVVVRTEHVQGTGFFIHPEGWLLTNYHVARTALPDPKTGALRANVHLGTFDGKRMRVVRESLPALVYKMDPVRDLALLKLIDKPKQPLPTVPLAKNVPGLGADCVAIGHPAVGSLWTVRSGDVSAINDWPRERPDLMLPLLAMGKGEGDKLEQLLKGLESCPVILSTVNASPGDSGGPLVNKDGELIGVTFAIPVGNRGNLSFHIHLDAVKKFLEPKLPEGPPAPHIPELLPSSSTLYELIDLDRDGDPETLLFGYIKEDQGRKEKVISGLLLDLKKLNIARSATALANPATRKAWKAQFALHADPYYIAFYDTSGSGQIDLILFAAKEHKDKADVVLRRDGKEWKAEAGGGRSLLDPNHFTDRQLKRDFLPLVAALRQLVLK